MPQKISKSEKVQKVIRASVVKSMQQKNIKNEAPVFREGVQGRTD